MQKLQQKNSLSNTSKFSKYSHLGIYGNSNESSLLLFDCLWKVKAKYNVLCQMPWLNSGTQGEPLAT